MRRSRVRRQQGAALATVLFLMLAMLMMSLSSTRAALMAAKSARADRDRQVALAAAEAALLDAERDIDGAAGAAGAISARAAIFALEDAAAFAAGCSGGAERTGLCLPAAAPAVAAWQAVDLAGERSVEYGRFSGRSMPTGAAMLPARAPRYLIELLAAPGAPPRYRITAIGFGADAATLVVLQACYARAAHPGRGKRLGRREIANWPALHRAAL